MRKQTKEIEQFIVSNVRIYPRDIVRIVSEEFNISRQAANRHLRRMVEEEQLVATGATRNREYSLKTISEEWFSLPITPGLEEDKVWRERVEPHLKGLSRNVFDICYYGFGEMFNNVVDHSEGGEVTIFVEHAPESIRLIVRDDGVGVFNKLKTEFGYKNAQQAMLELSKGRLTTDSTRHTGQGIFFTSRMFDDFTLASDRHCYGHVDGSDDWFFEHDFDEVGGTTVNMVIAVDSKRTAKEVFDKYTTKGAFGPFDTTHVPVTLAKFGEANLVSRSEAKRLLTRLDSFKEVMLDFRGISTVGHSFVDEIFRVYRNSHPQVKLCHINTNKEVAKMIKSVEANEVASNLSLF